MTVLKNDFEIRDQVVAIFLKRKSGEVFETIIDKEDFDKVNDFPGTWFWKNGYACGLSGQRYSTTEFRKNWYMHRVVNETPDGLYVDHINFDRLDNRKCNLRKCTYAENIRNRRTLSSNKSGYKGVHWNKRDKTWRVDIRIDGKVNFLGSFDNYEDAVKCSMLAYSELHSTSPESRMDTNINKDAVNSLKRKKSGLRKHNKCGHKNIFWNKRYGKWTAYMRIGNKQYSSSFSDIESAIEKVIEYEKIRGDYIAHNSADS